MRALGLRYYFKTPEDAIRYQEAFDAGKRARSFMLVLRITDLLFAVPIMHHLVHSQDHPHYEPVGPTGTRTR
jgi:hypothetical protein